MEKNQGFKVGDVVRVKPQVKDPDIGSDIGGWQGRISEVDPSQDIICIDWDSLTLKNIPASIITHCEEKGLGWEQIYLEMAKVEPATARDTEAEVAQVLGRLQTEHAWDHLGEEGKNIAKVLAGVDPGDDMAAFKAWGAHLQQVLQFPFAAEVSEWQERGSLQVDDKVIVQRIADVVDLYGVLVVLRHKHRIHYFPLCDLEVSDKESPNYGHVLDYAVWFANR